MPVEYDEMLDDARYALAPRGRSGGADRGGGMSTPIPSTRRSRATASRQPSFRSARASPPTRAGAIVVCGRRRRLVGCRRAARSATARRRSSSRRPISAPARGARAALDAAAAGRPIVLERPLLRADVAADRRRRRRRLAPPSALRRRMPRSRAIALRSALRDAIGWARVLAARAAGAPLGGGGARRGHRAARRRAAGAPVSLVFAAQPGAPERGRHPPDRSRRHPASRSTATKPTCASP